MKYLHSFWKNADCLKTLRTTLVASVNQFSSTSHAFREIYGHVFFFFFFFFCFCFCFLFSTSKRKETFVFVISKCFNTVVTVTVIIILVLPILILIGVILYFTNEVLSMLLLRSVWQRHVNHPSIDHHYKCQENNNYSRVPQLSLKAPISPPGE